MRSVAWFKQVHDANELEMHPPFQRNPVWTVAQRAYLIDTILSDYPIPEIYMQEVVTDRGVQQHIVVDGQQRITSCLRYLEGDFSLDGDESPLFADMYFEDLSAENKKKIFQYNFVVRMLPDVEEPVLRQIFRRLNRNVVALNRQELRHATYWGPFIKMVERLAEDDFWTWAGVFSANDFRRMLDAEYVSELAVSVLHGLQNKKDSLERWYEVYESDFEEREQVEGIFEAVCGEIRLVVPEMRRTRWRRKSDLYTLFCLLAEYRESLPFDRETRKALSKSLARFDDVVTTFLSLSRQDETNFDAETGVLEVEEQLAEGTPEVIIPHEVSTYAFAVQRAASDLGNRKRRREMLRTWLLENEALPKEPDTPDGPAPA